MSVVCVIGAPPPQTDASGRDGVKVDRHGRDATTHTKGVAALSSRIIPHVLLVLQAKQVLQSATHWRGAVTVEGAKLGEGVKRVRPEDSRARHLG